MTVAAPMIIKRLVAYQDGTIVSRTLLNQNAGSVTLFAFDEGQELSEHTAPYDALVIVIDGRADITISGEHFRVEEGQTIKMPANRPHSLKASTKFMMLLIMIRK